MAEGFYVTNKGIEIINAAIPDENKVVINKAKFGSGGTSGDWNYDISAMVSEQYSKNLDPETDSYKISDTDPKALFIRVVVPPEISCTINEVGFFDESDNLIIYGIVREQTKAQGVKYQYDCWVKFDNVDTASVEIKIISSEYEKVEKLVEDTKTEFDQRINQIEDDFSLENYPTQSDIEALDNKFATKQEFEAFQTEFEEFTGGEDGGGLSEYLKKSDASSWYLTKVTAQSTYLPKLEASNTYVAKVEGKDLVSSTDITQITTNKTDIASLKTGKVDKVEGSSLATTAQLTQIETNKTDIASLKTDKADKSQLTGLATESYVDNKVENLGDLKGSCLKSELEDKKAECKANDMYIVTDDDNHIYFYNGTDWTDTSAKAHVDLSDYYDKGTIDSSLSNKVDKVSGKELVSTTDITQITTNKTNIEDLQTRVGSIESDLDGLLTVLEEVV